MRELAANAIALAAVLSLLLFFLGPILIVVAFAILALVAP